MKKLLLSIVSIGTLSIATSQCTDIFISEYVEGSSNNKAIELYNPTSLAINLTGYELRRYSNGSSTQPPSDKIIALGGTINAYSTYVIVIDKRNPQGTGQEAPVWDCLQAKADTFLCPDYNINNVMYFNGNDALALLNGSTLIDFFGVLGQDPSGGAWPDSNTTDGLTADHSLIRKETIQQGIATPPTTLTSGIDFDPRLEWYDAGKNRFQNLGSHDCGCLNANITVIDTNYGCPATGIKEVEEINFSIFPNPSNTGSINIVSEKSPVNIRIFNALGSVIYNEKSNRNNIQSLNTSDWTKGLYFISLRFENGTESTKKITIN
jgi:hypothetical protein